MTAPLPAEQAPEAGATDQGYWWWLRQPPAEPPTRFEGFTRAQVEGTWPAHTRTIFVFAAALAMWILLLWSVVAFLSHVAPALGL